MQMKTATPAVSVTFQEADFLMHCIEDWGGKTEDNFLDFVGTVMPTYKQIEQLWEGIQEQKFA